jgi:hypothetical protein
MAELSRRELDLARAQSAVKTKLEAAERMEKEAEAKVQAAEAKVQAAEAKVKKVEAEAAEAARVADAKIDKLTLDLASANQAREKAEAEAATKAVQPSAENGLQAAAADKKPKAQADAAPAEPELAGAAPDALVGDRPMPPLKHHTGKRISKKFKTQVLAPHFQVLEKAGYENAEAQHALQSVLIAMQKVPDAKPKPGEDYNMVLTHDIMAANELARRNKVVKDATLLSSRIRRAGGIPVADKPYLALFYLHPDAEEYVTSSENRQITLARSVAAVNATKSAYGVALMIDLLFNDLEAWKDGRMVVTFTESQRKALMLIRGLHVRTKNGKERIEGPRYYPVRGILREDGRVTVDELIVFGLRKAIWCGRASKKTIDDASDFLPNFARVFIPFPDNDFCPTLIDCLQVAKERSFPEPTVAHLQSHYNRYC